MPLTAKGEEIKAAMVKEYGAKKGEQVFYASRNKGTITGVDAACITDEHVRKADAILAKCDGDVSGLTHYSLNELHALLRERDISDALREKAKREIERRKSRSDASDSPSGGTFDPAASPVTGGYSLI